MGLVERLCSKGATHVEIADWLRLSLRTLEYWLADEKTTYLVARPAKKDAPVVMEELTLRTIMSRGYSRMRISIRRQQMALLKAGNATMGVWLGKQYLGQTDRLRVEPPKPDADGGSETPVTLEQLLRDYRKVTKP